MAINIDNQTKDIYNLLRNGISAEEIANSLSSALQAAEKQIAEELATAKKAEEEEAAKKAAAKEKLCELRSHLCKALRDYVSCAHKKTYNKLIEMHEGDFTDDELIGLIDHAVKNTATAIKLYETFEGLFPTEVNNCKKEKEAVEQNSTTNWEKLFGDFFDKYNL